MKSEGFSTLKKGFISGIGQVKCELKPKKKKKKKSYPYRILNRFASRLSHMVKFWGSGLCAQLCVNPTTLVLNLIENFVVSGTVVEQSPLIHIVTLKPSH